MDKLLFAEERERVLLRLLGGMRIRIYVIKFVLSYGFLLCYSSADVANQPVPTIRPDLASGAYFDCCDYGYK